MRLKRLTTLNRKSSSALAFANLSCFVCFLATYEGRENKWYKYEHWTTKTWQVNYKQVFRKYWKFSVLKYITSRIYQGLVTCVANLAICNVMVQGSATICLAVVFLSFTSPRWVQISLTLKPLPVLCHAKNFISKIQHSYLIPYQVETNNLVIRLTKNNITVLPYVAQWCHT